MKRSGSLYLLSLIFLILFATLTAGAASSPDSQQQGFSGAKALAYVEELCKPEYAGRFTGHPGATLAAEWIGGRFES